MAGATFWHGRMFFELFSLAHGGVALHVSSLTEDCASQVPPFGSVASHPLEALRRLQVVDRTTAANLRELFAPLPRSSLSQHEFSRAFHLLDQHDSATKLC